MNKESLIRIVWKDFLLNTALGFVAPQGSSLRACSVLFLSWLHLTSQTFLIPFPSLTVERRSRRDCFLAYSIPGVLPWSDESLWSLRGSRIHVHVCDRASGEPGSPDRGWQFMPKLSSGQTWAKPQGLPTSAAVCFLFLLALLCLLLHFSLSCSMEFIFLNTASTLLLGKTLGQLAHSFIHIWGRSVRFSCMRDPVSPFAIPKWFTHWKTLKIPWRCWLSLQNKRTWTKRVTDHPSILCIWGRSEEGSRLL